MRKEEFCEILGDVSDAYIVEARLLQPAKQRGWIRWAAAAACLCLAAGLGAFALFHSVAEPASGLPEPDMGGNLPDGIDPVVASVAVFPATETLEDVEDAVIRSIGEDDAYSMETLGAYLPARLPDGYRFQRASLYETTMKGGTSYHMLRVIYTDEAPDTAASAPVGADEPAADPGESGSELVVFVMDFKPDTERTVYDPAELTEHTLSEIGGSTFHLGYGDIYVGISPMEVPADELLAMIRSIG